MVQGLQENQRYAAAGWSRSAKRGQCREICHVAGAEIQRSRRLDETAGERREFVFKLRMRARMAAEQMRSAAARAVFLCAFRQCFAQGFVRGQPEIIVARKADDLASVHRHVRGAGAVGDSATTT